MFISQKKCFQYHQEKKIEKENKLAKREETLKYVIDNLPGNLNSVSTTGILSRELYEILKEEKRVNNFMCVGGMGHAISVACGLAHNTKKIFYVSMATVLSQCTWGH